MKIVRQIDLVLYNLAYECCNLTNFSELMDQELMEAYFPIEQITSDYLNASSSIRDFRSQVTTIRFKISSLLLDPIYKDKFLRLVGLDRYDTETDTVTITADRCPYRLQNKEYCEYLLKALYYESRNREDWEKEKLPFDAIDYQPDETSEVDVQVSKVLNEGENIRTLEDYKSATLKSLGLKNELPVIP